MTTEDAILAAVLAAPDDDLPRLVLADHYEGELGQPERAAWIRIQCELERTMPDRRPWYVPGNWPDKVRPTSRQNLERHIWAKAVESEQVFDWFRVFDHNSASEAGVGFIWGDDPTADKPDGYVSARATIRRGFVSEIRCTLAEWCGCECGRCAIRRRMAYQIEVLEGDAMGYPARNLADDLMELFEPCTSCHGTGRTAGIGPQIVRRHPVERVVLVGQASYPMNRDERVAWFHPAVPDGREERCHDLPEDMFYMLKMYENRGSGAGRVKWYTTREAADVALSAAAIAWAKSHPPK